MIKERVWPVRVMYMLIAAALAISLIITAAPALKVSADPGLSEWDRVSTPSEDDWVLSPQSYIVDFAVGEGGEVAYAIVKKWDGWPPEFYLLKSTDHAATWKDITDGLEDVLDEDEDIDELLQVACDPEDPDFVAVALALNVSVSTPVHVYLSEDGGASFRDTGEIEDGGVAIPDDGVFALEVAPEEDGMRNIAIGGTDWTDGLIFRCLALGDIGTGWIDATDYDGWDIGPTGDVNSEAVVDIHIAPSWSADNTILVATATGSGPNQDVHLQCGTWGTTEGWNADSVVAMDAVPIIEDVGIPLYGIGGAVAGITTPLDYSGRYSDKRQLWVWVNYRNPSTWKEIGTIFRVKNASVNPIGWQIEEETLWLTNVSYLGYISEGKAIAGMLGTGISAWDDEDDPYTECCTGVQVYRNDNIVTMDICCYDWEAACKPPTGRWAMVAFYVSDDKAYAVTLGAVHQYDESAWSVSFDDGDVWNQLSLIDTHIDFLSDVAVSPDCNKTMLMSVNLKDMSSWCECRECTGCDSVWLHAENLPEAEEYSGKWLRTWCGNLEGFDLGKFFHELFDDDGPSGTFERGLLRLAPEETTGDTVYLADLGTPNVYWNEMETLGCWEKGTATVDDIVDLAVKDKETIYALDFYGNVAMSDDYAVGWHKPVDSELGHGWTIAVWGDHVLVGGCDGDWNYSDDGAETWVLEWEPEELESGFLVTIAFDSYFDQNNTIYAAGAWFEEDATTGTIGRWVIGDSDEWEYLGVDEELAYTGLVLDRPSPGNPMTSPDTGGVLYASYVGWYEGGCDWFGTGVARHLKPAEDIVCEECVEWDYLEEGLPYDLHGCDLYMEQFFMVMPEALKICGCLTPDSNSKLFAIGMSEGYDMEKAKFGTVWMFEDCYAKAAPDVISPADGASIPADPCPEVCLNIPFTLKWDRLCDACSYDIQIAYDEDFDEIVRDIEHYFPGETTSYLVEQYLFCEFTYYWRVRASDAATEQYIRSWWSEPRSFTIEPAPSAGVNLIAPEAGATDVATTNVGFTWSSVASADAYDWLLSANADLSSPIATNEGLTTTATTYTGTALDYETPYFWQVIAYKEGAAISMSGIGTFTTVAEEVTPPPPPEPTTPVWVWVVIAIGAVLVIVVIVLIFRTRRV